MGIIQSIEGLNRTKKVEEGQICFLLRLRHASSPALGHQLLTPATSDLDWDFHHWLPWFSGLQGLDWNYTTAFPGSPACRWQLLGLLSLHNPMSQSLTTNLYASSTSLSTSRYPFCSVSLRTLTSTSSKEVLTFKLSVY